MSFNTLKIATRQSPLALWQANFIKSQLEQQYKDLKVELIGITTKGDKHLETSLAKIGGKGLFIKELEQALLEKKACLAVHSMKDMTVNLPKEFCIATICERAEVEDAFVSNNFSSLNELPQNSVVGTSSLRRQSQLRMVRPDLELKLLRGNVNTRLSKLDQGDYDAIILATAGLKRLNLEARIRAVLPTDLMLPAVAQGTLGIETLRDNQALINLLQFLEHPPTRHRTNAERAMNRRLDGGCTAPIAGYASIENHQLTLKGLVASPDGQIICRAQASSPIEEAEALGYKVADDLLMQGADAILKALR